MIRSLRIFTFFLYTFILQCKAAEKTFDDSIHYYVSFTSDPSLIESAPPLEDGTNAPSEEIMRIVSKNNERYACKMPVVTAEEKKALNYSGPTAGQLLESKLYKDKMCSYLIDVYWTYQVCHGRYVIQYHEDKETIGRVSRTEFYLGNYDSFYKSDSEETEPPKLRMENEEYPSFSVRYTHGTTCDVTGSPRNVKVLYICVEKVQHKILSVTEVESCSYEIVIMTDVLCEHPAYQLSTKKDYEILCWNEASKNDKEAKPMTLQRLDDYHDSTFKREYTVTEVEQEDEEQVIDAQDFERLRGLQHANYKLVGKKKFQTKDSLANNDAVVSHTVNRILTGEDCIVHDNGWWKYEFCYGKHVVQYHEDEEGNRVENILGVFDVVIHKEWVKQNPDDRGPIMDGSYIGLVNHLYSKGDLCDDNRRAHRDAEVRIRCATADHSALAFSMQVNEPAKCQYVVLVESERFCEPLQYSDEFGLIPIALTKIVQVIDIEREEDTEEDNEKSIREEL